MNRIIYLLVVLSFSLGFFFTSLSLISLSLTQIARAQECTESWECGDARLGANYCCGDAVCNDEARPVCISGGCFLETPIKVHDDSCGGYGCSNGACNPAPATQVCTPNSQGDVCDTAYCPNGDVCAQGHKYCLWDGSGYGDCSEEVNNCATQCPGPVITPAPGPTNPPPPPPAISCNNNGAQDNGETGVDCGGGNCGACPSCSLNVNPASFTTGNTARYTVTSSSIPSGSSLYWGGKDNGTAITESGPVSGFQANTSWSVSYEALPGSYERYANIKWSGSFAGGQCKTTPNIPITVCPVPTPPTSISVSCLNPGTTATISWSGATNASAYALRADKDPNSWDGTATNGDVVEDNITSTSYNLTTSGNSNYKVWVHSKNSCGTLSSSVIQTAFSCVPNCNITSNNPSSVTVNTPQTFNVTAISSTGNTQAGLQVYNASGSVTQDYTPDPPTSSPSTTNKNSSFNWTPTSTGTYTVICRAWNDSIAECKGGNKKEAGVAAQYDCIGPNASKTINVCQPTGTIPACRTTAGSVPDGNCGTTNYSSNCTVCNGNTCTTSYSVSGTMYIRNADGTNTPYTGGFTVNSSSGGTVSNGDANGHYSVSGISSIVPADGYYQFNFSIPAGYKVISSALAGWSCPPWAQGETCPGPTLYGSVLGSQFSLTSPNVTGVNIYIQQVPTISGRVLLDYNHNGGNNGGLQGATVELSNLLVNPSFEYWSNGYGSGADNRAAPDGWTLDPNDGYSRAETATHDGSYSWMRAAYGDGGTFMSGYQNVAVKPDTTYVLSGWLYESNFFGGASAKLCEATPDGGTDIQCTTTSTSSTNWQKLTTTFTTGSSTTLISVKFAINSSQTAFWDDFTLTQLQTTDSAGGYFFNNLPYGDYSVSLIDDNPGYSSLYYGSAANPFPIVLTYDAMTAVHNFTTTPLYTLAGSVFNDKNSNSIKDASDTKYPDPNLPFQKDQPPATVALGNLLYNPSFENWSSAGTSGSYTDKATPKGWFYDRGSGPSWRNSTSPVDWGDSANPNVVTLIQNRPYSWGVSGEAGIYQDIRVKQDTNYSLSGWLQSYALWWRSYCWNNPSGTCSQLTNPQYVAKLCAKYKNNDNNWVDITCAWTHGQPGDNPGTENPMEKITANFNSGNNTTLRIYSYIYNNNDTFWDDFNLSEIRTTDTNGNYSFTNSMVSGTYQPNMTPAKMLYSKDGNAYAYASPIPSFVINETNYPATNDPATTRIANLSALVVPAPAPNLPSIAPQAGMADPSCLTASENGSRLTISWTNNAIPVSYVDISTDQNFTTYYHRAVSGSANTASSTDGTGFNGYQGVTGTLTYNPSPTTYYVRLWNDSANGSSTSFSFPACIPTLTAYCTFSPASINTNEAVTWWAHPTPPDDGTYSYSWSGTAITDGQPHPTSSMTQPYSSSGSYSARVQVTSGSQSITTDTCTTLDSFGQPIIDPANGLPINLKVTDAVRPWIQTTGDVHSNTSINAPGGPTPAP